MAPNPDVLQLRLGALVTLVLTYDRQEDETTISVVEQGVVAKRTSVTFPGDQNPRIAKFLQHATPQRRSRVTDDPVVEIDPAEEITRPEKVGK